MKRCIICKKRPAAGKQHVCANCLLEGHFEDLELLFAREVRFHPQRKWRFDYTIGDRIAVEIEGGIYSHGRHTRGKGFENDMRKYNAATVMGWRVLRFSTNQVMRGEAKAFLAQHLVERQAA